MIHTPATNTDNSYLFVRRYGYYNHYQEPTFGLLQLGVRYYDPSVGRFTQRNPLSVDGAGQYDYSADGPLVNVDPSGLDPYKPPVTPAQCEHEWKDRKVNCLILKEKTEEKADDEKGLTKGMCDTMYPDIPYGTDAQKAQRTALRELCKMNADRIHNAAKCKIKKQYKACQDNAFDRYRFCLQISHAHSQDEERLIRLLWELCQMRGKVGPINDSTWPF